MANDLFFYGQWNPNECHCTQQCLRILFTSSLESTTDKYNTEQAKVQGFTRARVRIYYQVRETPSNVLNAKDLMRAPLTTSLCCTCSVHTT